MPDISYYVETLNQVSCWAAAKRSCSYDVSQSVVEKMEPVRKKFQGIIMNPYFEVAEPQIITDIDKLLSFNMKKMYYRPGDEKIITDMQSAFSPHQTAGIFRG